MQLKRINSAIDRVGRNDINENFDILERAYGKTAIDAQEAKTISEQAKLKSDNAVVTSDDAMILAESIQNQFNQVVIEGDSSVEAAQARVGVDATTYDTLKARLDAENAQVTQKLEQITTTKEEQESAMLGEEMLTSNGWVLNGWTGNFTTGFTHTVGQLGEIRYPLNAVAGAFYQVELTLNATNPNAVGGLFYVSVGGSEDFDTYKGEITDYKFGIRAVTNGDLVIKPVNANLDGTITNISVKPIIEISPPSFKIEASDGLNAVEGRFTKKELRNVFLGVESGQYNTTGDDNASLGYKALERNTSGFFNIALGSRSLEANTTGSRNFAGGFLALAENISGHRNIAVGSFALCRSQHAAYNIGIGADALWYLSTGEMNVALGYRNLGGLRTGSGNTAIGFRAGDSGDTVSDFSNCTIIGRTAGAALQTGANDNTFLGRSAGYTITTGQRNIMIGSQATAPNPTDNYRLNIGDFIFGEMDGVPAMSVGRKVTRKGIDANGLVLQVGREARAGYLELVRGSNTHLEKVGGINFINDNNLNTDANTRATVAYMTTETVTTNNNANGNAGSNVRMFVKPENAALVERFTILANGNVGISVPNPVARLHLPAGGVSVGTAPLKFATGSLNTVPQNGCLEYDGVDLYFTNETGVRRKITLA